MRISAVKHLVPKPQLGNVRKATSIMRTRHKIIEKNALYFLTFTVVEKIPVFTNKLYFEMIISDFQFYRNKYNLKVYFYVLMDNHIHLICSSEVDLRKAIKSLKSYLAKEIIKVLKNDKRKWILDLLKFYKKSHKNESTYQIWEEGSYPKQILNDQMLEQKACYIHLNPVRRGFVRTPQDWRYSSANRDIGNPFKVDILEL